MKNRTCSRLPFVLPLLLVATLITGCTTLKFTYDWEFYSKEASHAVYEGWTRSQLRSSFPEAIPLQRTIVGTNPTYGVVGKETWRIDANFIAEIDFVYRENLPGGEFTPAPQFLVERKLKTQNERLGISQFSPSDEFVIEPASLPLRLPEARPDDRVVGVKILKSSITSQQTYSGKF